MHARLLAPVLLIALGCLLGAALPPAAPRAGVGLGDLRMRPLLTVNEDARGGIHALRSPHGWTPQDLWRAYALPRNSDAHGTVVLVEAGNAPTLRRDVGRYRAMFGLPPCSSCLRVVNQEGQTTPLPPDDRDWAVETSLDTQMVAALCPRCAVIVVEAAGADLFSLLTAEATAARLHPDAISNSWGTPEITAPPHGCPADSRYYGGCITNADLAAQTALSFRIPGVAVLVASGDSGYGVNFPAASPDVIAVGGTRLVTDTTSPRGFAETVWGASRQGKWEGSGSGCSAFEPKPAWQQDRCLWRTVADVAFVADPETGVAVYDSTPYYSHRHREWRAGWLTVGGTSVGAPAIAALYALAGNARSMGTAVGAHLYSNWRALNGVTEGTNAITCTCYRGLPYLRVAQPGYNGPAGWGTPHGVGAF